jgi:hypothetical protein
VEYINGCIGDSMKIENSVIEDSLLEARYLIEGAADNTLDLDTWILMQNAVLYLKEQYEEFRKENE